MTKDNESTTGPKLRLGVSSCLLGEPVRWNGGHKRDRFLVGTLGRYVQWVPVCPEVEMGLSTPRETLRLIGDPASPRLWMTKTEEDYTEEMRAWSRARLDELARLELHGYVLKKDSPSCGLFRVKVYGKAQVPTREGRGIFAEELVRALPLLPIEEEGRLHDMGLRENFIQRVFVYYRWVQLLKEGPSPGGLVRFHSAHKLTMMAHSPNIHQQLGRLTANAGRRDWRALTDEYGALLMQGLAERTSRGKHANVLQHLMGFVKDDLTGSDKEELLGLIRDYQAELIPLIVPLTLLRHHLRRPQVPDWVHQQVYLNPYPKELALLNHV